MVLNIETISYQNIEIVFLSTANFNQNMFTALWRLFSSLTVDKILMGQLRCVYDVIMTYFSLIKIFTFRALETGINYRFPVWYGRI